MNIRSILSGVLLLLLAACGAPTTPPAPPVAPTAAPANAQLQATVTLAPTVAPNAQPTKPPAPSPTPQVEVQPTAVSLAIAEPAAPPAKTSDTKTPLLVFPTDHGLMTVRADGTGKANINHAAPVVDRNLSDGISARGWLAFRTGADSLDVLGTTAQTVTLNVQQLPNGPLTPITPLFSPKMEQAIKAAAGDRTAAIEAGIAIMENSDVLKWSPDGRYLAFIAAIDGPSSDVYSYDRETGQINRLTDGPNQAARLFWSPDSQWIVHEEVESFGTGAGWSVRAVWAAAPDGNNTRKLYDVASSGDEVFVEWVSPDTFLVYSWTPMGWRGARLVNVNTGEARLVGPKFDVQTLAYDPKTQTRLYFVDDFTAQQNGLSGGLYLAASGQPKSIASGDWYDTRWLPHTQLFFAKGRDGVLSVALDGAVKNYANEGALPIDSPDGAWLLAWGDGNFTSPIGLRLYTPDGELKREITPDSVSFATWSPDSNGVFYQSGGILYFAEMPNGTPQVIGETTAQELNNIGWVKP